MSTEPETRADTGRTDEADLSVQIGEATRRQELADPDEGLPFLDRAVNKFVELIGAGVLCTIVGTIFVNAVSRYAFNYSFSWVEELVIYLTPWLAMTGMFLPSHYYDPGPGGSTLPYRGLFTPLYADFLYAYFFYFLYVFFSHH